MKIASTFSRLYRKIAHRSVPFFVAFFCIMFISYGFFFVIDFIPEPIVEEKKVENTIEDKNIITKTINLINGGLQKIEDEVVPSIKVIIPEKDKEDQGVEDVSLATSSQVDTHTPVVSSTNALPTSMYFDALDKAVVIKNPTSRAIPDLDAALLNGAVRHPDSADFENTGNIFILGHSSYLPNVFNKNFQAFNGIQDLSWGDSIRLRSVDTEYIYRVERVYEAKASDVIVPNSRGKAKLTLATCDSFGSKNDRFIVEAVLVKTKAL